MNTDRGTRRFFYALTPRWWSPDRFYRIYVNEEMLSGAYIAGQIYDNDSAASQLQRLRFFLFPLVNRLLANREKRESLYDSTDPFSTEMLSLDRRNFQIPQTDIVRVQFQPKRSYWTAHNIGSVTLDRFSGRQRLILVGEQDASAIFAMLQAIFPAIEVADNAKLLSQSSANRKREIRSWTFSAIASFGLATLSGASEIMGIAAHPLTWPVTIMFSAFGVYSAVEVWRAWKQRSDEDETSP